MYVKVVRRTETFVTILTDTVSFTYHLGHKLLATPKLHDIRDRKLNNLRNFKQFIDSYL